MQQLESISEKVPYAVSMRKKLLERGSVTPTKSSSKDDIKVNVIVDKDEFLKAVAAQGAQHRTFDWNDNILQVMSLNTSRQHPVPLYAWRWLRVYLEQLVDFRGEC